MGCRGVIPHILILIACSSGFTQEPPPISDEQVVLSPREFTDAYVALLRVEYPNLEIAVDSILVVRLTAESGRIVITYLIRSYRDYILDPDQLDAYLRRPMKGLEETLEESLSPSVNLDNVVPVVVGRKFVDDFTLATSDPGMPKVLFEKLNEELWIAYARDDSQRIAYIDRKEVFAIDSTFELLRIAAVSNLKRIMPPIKWYGIGNVIMLTCGGDYESSLLLRDDLWFPDVIAVNGEYVVAVPARDLLFVTGSQDSVGLAQIRQKVIDVQGHFTRPVSNALFILRDGEWQIFDRMDSLTTKQ